MLAIRLMAITLSLGLCGAVTADAGFLVGVGGEMVNLSGGDAPRFVFGPSWRVHAGTSLSPDWLGEISVSRYKLYDDTQAGSLFTFSSDESHRTRARKATDITLLLRRHVYRMGDRITLHGDLGGGVSIWKMLDPSSGVIQKTTSETGGPTDVSVSEVFLAAGMGTDFRLSGNFRIGFLATMNYLTGTGQEFVAEYKDSLSNWIYRFGVNISYSFGRAGRSQPAHPKSVSGKIQPIPVKAGNSLGPTSAKALRGKVVDDSDGDGVPDLYDLCPNTPKEAAGLVDINGCPIDTDFDGIPDYRDDCPDGLPGAVVDKSGCPIDSDGDGVPDGIDNCPNTRAGVEVDSFGCVDLTPLAKPMILHIKYDPGSFEVDQATRAKLDKLANLLLAARGVRVEISGYTDNIGLPEDNKALSEKRARRVMDYLIGLGVDSSRLRAIGRGETNFIASNDTQDGRQQNRRVELIFY
jgi:OOP family OmpA-OmpF porin